MLATQLVVQREYRRRESRDVISKSTCGKLEGPFGACRRLRAGDELTGMYGPPLRRKRNVGCHKLVCTNVYGLCWSESLLARMECAALFSPLVIQSRETSSGYGFGERRVRPLCHLLIRQQTWQETIISPGTPKRQLHPPTRDADMVHPSRDGRRPPGAV